MAVTVRSHTDVVVAALVLDGLKVFRSMGPPDPLSEAPYCVIYAGSATTADGGTAADLYADVEPETQVTSVGTDPEQAEWLSDRVFSALVGPIHVPPAGRAWLRPGAPVGHVLTRPVERDLDFGSGAPLFYVVSIYSLPSTPA